MAVLSRLLMKGCQFRWVLTEIQSSKFSCWISANSMFDCRWNSLVKANLLLIGRVTPKLFPSVTILSVPLVVRSFTRVSCEQSKFSRVATVVPNDNQLSKVPWGDILSLLRPEFWLLLTAVISAVIVAVINIQIPLLLGSLVNGIAKLSGSEDSIVSLLKPIALKLVFYYGLQAGETEKKFRRCRWFVKISGCFHLPLHQRFGCNGRTDGCQSSTEVVSVFNGNGH